MTSATFDASVVICAYTEARWDGLLACVRSVQRQTTPPREIIVVIDHNPAMLGRVRKEALGVVAVDNVQLPGASGARNAGVEVARGSIVVFIDDDAKAAPDWLAQLLAHYADPRVLGVDGLIEPSWVHGRPRWFPDEFNWTVGCTYRGMPEETTPIRNLIAANMSVRRDVYQALGGFRAGFGNVKVEGRASLLRLHPRAGDEEAEFCIRGLQRWPQRVWLHEPRAKVSHLVPAQRGRGRYFLSQCYDEGLGAAMIVDSLGRQDGLSLEREYTLHVLPQGVARGIADAVLRRDVTGVARSTAIVAGFAMTALGYILGRSLGRFVRDRETIVPRSVGQAAYPSWLRRVGVLVGTQTSGDKSKARAKL